MSPARRPFGRLRPILKRLFDAGYLSWDDYGQLYEAERYRGRDRRGLVQPLAGAKTCPRTGIAGR